MKKALLFITLSVLIFSGWSQTVIRLDSGIYHTRLNPNGGWERITKSIYDYQTPPDVVKVQIKRINMLATTPVWLVICNDSIIEKPNYRARYTMNDATGEYYLAYLNQKILYPDGRVHIHEIQDLDKKGQLTFGTSKYEYTYNALGEVETESRFTWKTPDQPYVLKTRLHFTYDANGRLLNKRTEKFYKKKTFGEKETYEYTPSGKVAKISISACDNGLCGDAWKESFKSYSQQGELVTEYEQRIVASGQIEKIDSSQHVYDQTGRITLTTSYIPTSTGFDPSTQIEYLYSQNGRVETVIESVFRNGMWKKRSEESRTRNYEGKVTRFTRTHEDFPKSNLDLMHHYSSGTSDIEPKTKIFCDLPNPLSPNMQFLCAEMDPEKSYEIAIINLEGRVLLKEHVQKGQRLSFLATLPRQVYIVQVYEEGILVSTEKKLITAN